MSKELNKPLVIIGGPGHGCVIESCVNDNRRRFNNLEWEIKGFCNDYDTEVDGYPVLGKLCDIPTLLKEGYFFSWGIHLIANNFKTAELFNKIDIPDEHWATIVHGTSFIDSSVILGPGAFVMYNAYIAPRTRIGKCAMVKANTNIGHDVVCGNLSHIAMGATIVSYSKIGYCADIAVGSTMLAHTKIGDYAMLGAASLLTHNIPDGEIWVGNPARKLRNVKQDADNKFVKNITDGGGKWLITNSLCSQIHNGRTA